MREGLVTCEPASWAEPSVALPDVDVLGVRVTLRCERAPAQDLSILEQQEQQRLAGTPRLEGWLRGRAALKPLLRRLQLTDDTQALRFPHRRLSLTHGGTWAVAAGLLDDDDVARVAGIGVDVEPQRRLSKEHTRFFLSERERFLVPSSDERLRLWTVKEALFKSDPDNAVTHVGSYETSDPSALAGVAFSNRGRLFDYVSRPALGGWLTVALCWQE